MIPEEIQQTIAQMLAVQRDLQESQLRNTENIRQLQETQNQIQETQIRDKEEFREAARVLFTNAEQLTRVSIGLSETFQNFIVETRQSKLEMDQRFNILLEEIRATNHRVTRLEEQVNL